jgi:glucose/arabinose dehydrogenase
MRLQDLRPGVGILAGALALLCAARPAEAQLRIVPYVSGLNQPVAFIQDPADTTVQYVVEQGGTIRVVSLGVLQTTPFLNISAILAGGGERGLLGLAFPPNYGSSGRFYVYFTRAADGYIVVARFRRSANRFIADPGSRLDLRWSTGDRHIVHPYSNHNAGCLAFGPDGMLYVASGDGGNGGDPHNYAQNTSSLLGKILRLDVSVSDADPNGWTVPPGNAGLPRPEIWSLGWRNPWRFSFDSPALGGTGAMIVADVGQSAWEEIDYEPAGRPGRNYGWRNREGAHNYDVSIPPASTPLIDPIFEYDRAAGRSITGGYVYRGPAMPEYRGRYFFGDYVTRRIWSLALTVSPMTGEATASGLVDHTAALVGSVPVGGISSFGVDAQGELYVVDHTRGLVLRLSRDLRAPTNLRFIRP